MMSGNNTSKSTNVLWSLLMGMVSFFIGGVLACIFIVRFDNFFLAPIIAGGIGGLLLGSFLRMGKKIGRMVISSAVASLVGFLGSFMLVEGLVGGFGLLFPSVASNFEGNGIADIGAIILMGIVFGILFGEMFYGRKSIKLFSITCGIAAVPYSLLVNAMNSGHWIRSWLENFFAVFGKIDVNLLAIVMAFGTGVGLCIGLYNKSNKGHDEQSV